MEIQLSYNSLVNSLLIKLGQRKHLNVEIAQGNEKAAEEIIKLAEDTIRVRATFKETVDKYQGPVKCLGMTIAKATGRDSGASFPTSITLISGSTPDSGGSMKNWRTYVYKDTVIEFEVPKFIYDKFKNEYEDINIEIAPNLSSKDLINDLSIDDEDSIE